MTGGYRVGTVDGLVVPSETEALDLLECRMARTVERPSARW